MKLWQKFVVVVFCGGLVAGLTFLCGQMPEQASLFAAIGFALNAISSAFAGWPTKTPTVPTEPTV